MKHKIAQAIILVKDHAGVPGFEPGYLVLETRVLPLDDTPMYQV